MKKRGRMRNRNNELILGENDGPLSGTLSSTEQKALDRLN